MKTLICTVLFCIFAASVAKESPPQVQLYSQRPGYLEDENILICHVTGFHPPDITIQLQRNGVYIPAAKQTALAFNENWQFYLIKSASFTPSKHDTYTCNVNHMGKIKIYTWSPDV
ncbi:beta-2-microglobulin [Lampris incognitus]|uniref:beta-2-microglobulin n=1 Tax=Lampris incognitus TaxID=2546036 RepID=UPI0024B481C6|nr:beta-2-microglobulin [Lampris incognitus]